MPTMYKANHSKMTVEPIEIFRFTEGTVYFVEGDSSKKASRKNHRRGTETFSYWETREEAIEHIRTVTKRALELAEKFLAGAKKRYEEAQNLV